jgi:hypothetical protein
MSEKPKRPAPMTKSPSVTAHFSPNKTTPFGQHVVQLPVSNFLSNNNMKALKKQQFKNLLAGLEKTQNKMTTGSIQTNTSNKCTNKNNKRSCAIQGGKRTRKHKKSQRKTRRIKKH